jgi:hypothetical protein
MSLTSRATWRGIGLLSRSKLANATLKNVGANGCPDAFFCLTKVPRRTMHDAGWWSLRHFHGLDPTGQIILLVADPCGSAPSLASLTSFALQLLRRPHMLATIPRVRTHGKLYRSIALLFRHRARLRCKLIDSAQVENMHLESNCTTVRSIRTGQVSYIDAVQR